MKIFIQFSLILFCLLGQPSLAADSAVAFMYHRFGDSRFPSTNVTMEAFSAQLDLLQEKGFAFRTLGQVLDAFDSGEALPERTVVISVDDAYRSVYDNAWPLLQERNIPFTLFIATDDVDRGSRMYMSWQQLRELAAAGVEIGNHSSSHAHLVERLEGESEAQLLARIRADIETAQQRLQRELGEERVARKLFAYPFGEFDETLANLLASMGYTAFGQQSGPMHAGSDRRAIARFPVNERYSALEPFLTKALSLPLPLVKIEPWEPLTHSLQPPLILTVAEGVTPDRITCYASNQGLMQKVSVQGQQVHLMASEPFQPGRARYNCTLPTRQAGRYRWYSHPWLIMKEGEAAIWQSE